MNYTDALRTYVLSQLPADTALVDISVTWDDGDRWDPTYDGPNVAPKFDIRAIVRHGDPFTGPTSEVGLDTAMTMTAMLRALLAVGQ